MRIDDPESTRARTEEQIESLRAEANELLKSGRPDDKARILELFAQARELSKKLKKTVKWVNRYSVGTWRQFTPPLVDESGDIGLSSIMRAKWELVKNEETVREIIATRFGLKRMLEHDERTRNFGKSFSGTATANEVLNSKWPPSKYKRMYRDLDRFYGLLSRGLETAGMIDQNEGHLTLFTKMVMMGGTLTDTFDHVAMGEIAGSGAVAKWAAQKLMDGEMISQAETTNLLSGIRNLLLNLGSRPAGSVRGGESRFKR